jgi:hypothetical protein
VTAEELQMILRKCDDDIEVVVVWSDGDKLPIVAIDKLSNDERMIGLIVSLI